MAVVGARADRTMGHPEIQPQRKTRGAGIPRGLLAEDAAASGRRCVGKKRPRVPARSPGNDQAGKKRENRSVRGDSAWGWPDNFARGARAGRSQRLSPGSVGRFAARAGRLARIVSTHESLVNLENRAIASVRRFLFLLLPGRKNNQGIVSEKLSHWNAPLARRGLQLVINEGVVKTGPRGIDRSCGVENSIDAAGAGFDDAFIYDELK